MGRTTLLVAFVLYWSQLVSSGLTSVEISKFSTTGRYGATVTVHENHDTRFFISASGLPDHETDRVNPNSATVQNYNISILKTPEVVQVPGCVGMGMIGITRTGVAIYNPLAGGFTNAVEGSSPEVFDRCDGHASPNGAYHYHKIPDSCLYRGEVDEFIGVALDGFPIYGPRIGESQNVSESDLDKCHGKFVNGNYRYYVTDKFPYYLGCFKGRVVNERTMTQYNCSTDTSHWNLESYGYDYYLCHCLTSGGGGGGPRPECAPDRPNRPADCPPCPREGCVSTTRNVPPSTSTAQTVTRHITSTSTTQTVNRQVAGLTTNEISEFSASSNYGASVTVHTGESTRFFISASGLPDHETDRVNPNSATVQNYNISILKTPEVVPVPGCVGMGMIGITRTGVAIYNPLAGGFTNAVEGSSPKVFDRCDGHASPNGAYHYHKIPDSCLYRGEVDEFIGVALDGFPIYGPRIGESQNVSESDLDKCHGKFVDGRYRYYVTDKFPYYLGCFKGRVINEGTVTQYNCSTDSSHWNLENYGYNYYLCHCLTSGGAGGGGGRPRPECAPNSPNRPADCPPCPPEGCSTGLPNVGDGPNGACHVTSELLPFLSLFYILFLFLVH